MTKVNLMDALARSRDEGWLQHEANLLAWAKHRDFLNHLLAEAQAKGDQDLAEELEREQEVWFWQRPVREGE